MKNYVQKGDILPLTAPSGGVESGKAYLIGGLLVVALHDAAETKTFSAMSEGVAELPKEDSAAVFAEGAIAYWNDTAKELDTTSAGYYPAATVVEAAGATDATVKVKLFGYPTAAVS